MNETLTETERNYGGKEMPLRSYATLISAFGVLLAGTMVVASASRRKLSLGEIALLGLATHKLSRMVAKDRVTASLRAPFAKYVEDGEPGEVEEEARGEGMQKAVGQLVTCPFCVSPWIATVLTAGLLRFPGPTRAVVGMLAAAGTSCFLHHFYIKTSPKE